MSTGDVRSVPREARRYQGRPAGIVSRALAAGVDLLVVVVALVLGYAGFAAMRFVLDPTDFVAPTPAPALLGTETMVLLALYFAASWATTGRSYGAALFGLRVVGRRGNRLGVTVAAARAVLCVAFPLGLLVVPFSPNSRSLQDLVLRTAVIHDWAVRVPVPRSASRS